MRTTRSSLLSLPFLLLLVVGAVGAAMTIDQEYEKYLGEIPPECITSGDISPREALPDKNLFVAVKRAMLVANFSKNYTFNMNAGLGTTGTTGLDNMCVNIFRKQARACIHFKSIRISGSNQTSKNAQKAAHILAGFVDSYSRLVNRHRDRNRNNGPNDTRLTSATESEQLAHDLELALTSLFMTLKEERVQVGCFADNPWPQFFAELFFATCPNVKVVLSVRDYLEWGIRRQERHMHSHTSCICPKEKGVRDPMSITQCMRSSPTAHNAVDCKSVQRSTVSELSEGIRRHNQFVHSIIPPRFLLELNLFMSKYDESINFSEWSHANEQLVKNFLLPNSIS